MKKSLILSVICSSFVLGGEFVHPLPNSSRSIENGGTLSAIDAYQDGVGAMVVQKGRGIDNSPMNSLVFKYGNQAKSNTLSVGEQVLLSGTAEDKLLAGKLFADGIACNDNNPISIGETYLNGICQGGVVPPNGTACDDNNPLTYADKYTNSICAGIVDGTICNDSTSSTYSDKYTSGVCAGAIAYSCLDIKNSTLTNTNGLYIIKSGTSEISVTCDMIGGGWTLVSSEIGSSSFTGWSSVNTQSHYNRVAHGRFGPGSVTKLFSGIVPHSSVKTSLILYSIDSWDASDSAYFNVNGSSVSTGARPDPYSCSGWSSYSGYSGDDPWSGQGNQRCFKHLTSTINNNASTINLSVVGAIDQYDTNDESWAFSDVEIWVK